MEQGHLRLCCGNPGVELGREPGVTAGVGSQGDLLSDWGCHWKGAVLVILLSDWTGEGGE